MLVERVPFSRVTLTAGSSSGEFVGISLATTNAGHGGMTSAQPALGTGTAAAPDARRESYQRPGKDRTFCGLTGEVRRPEADRGSTLGTGAAGLGKPLVRIPRHSRNDVPR